MRLAAIQLHDARGQLAQERAVVGDEEERDLFLEQEFFQPKDGIEIEVIGRLVEEKDVGLAGQGARKKNAALQPAGKRGNSWSPGKPISSISSSMRTSLSHSSSWRSGRKPA